MSGRATIRGSKPVDGAASRDARRRIAAAGLAVGVGLLAMPAGAGERLACEGALGPGSSHEAVVARFGADAVTIQKVDGAEGETIVTTVVFAGDIKRRLELFWVDEAKRRGLADVRFSEGSTWVAPNGIAMGASLAEVEAANGRAFDLSGFDWDYGGMVSDWKGGALGAASAGGCLVSVGFSPSAAAPDKARRMVAGDFTFSSASAKMKAVAPTVSRLSFGYAR